MFVSVVEMAERFSYYGMSGNLITYLTNELKEPIPVAVKDVNTWTGVSALLPLLGAFIADSYLGRFTTILVSSIIYCLVILITHNQVTSFDFQTGITDFFMCFREWVC